MEHIFTEISFLVLIAGLLAWIASQTRQPVIIAYITVGVVMGPGGFKLVQEVSVLDAIAHIGITLLLFLAGMVLHPQKLVPLFKEASLVTLGGAVVACGAMFGMMMIAGFSVTQSLFAGLALMFSSTVMVIKLLPTTTLHQRHMGGICIAVLIIQDLIAVVILIFMSGKSESHWALYSLILIVKAAVLVIGGFMVEQWVLRKMMRKADQYHEVLYMLCLGWCLGMAALAKSIGLSAEVGAFIAGVAIARGPVSRFLHEQLKPLRDFFLMFFFFVLGARLNLFMKADLWVITIVAALAMGAVKSASHWAFFRGMGETNKFAKETGIRLGQGSEFGLIIAVAALKEGIIDAAFSQVIQLVIILTMIISSYVIIFSYPTPLGAKGTLKQD